MLLGGGALQCVVLSYFRPHRIYETQTVAIDDAVAWYASLSVMRLRCAKTAKQIDVLFWVKAIGDPRHTVYYFLLDTHSDHPIARGGG